MKTSKVSQKIGGAIFCAFVGAGILQAQVGIYGIGELPGAGENFSEVRAAIITSDGSIVAVGGANGQSWNTTANGGGGTTDSAVIWTQSSGLQVLPQEVAPTITNIGRITTASDVTESSAGTLQIASRSYYQVGGPANAKEQVVYSYGINSGTATYGSTTVLTPNISSNNQNAATAMSRDGSVVYGFATIAGNLVSTRWTAGTGVVNLGQIGSGVSNYPGPRAASSDGSVMVGITTLADTVTTNAFIYNSTTGFTTVGTLPGGTNSQGLGVSADGNIVFGSSESTAHPNGEAFFWNASNSTFTALGTPNDALIASYGGITADGSAAVLAFSDVDSTPATFVSEVYNSHGAFDLMSVLATGGVNMAGWSGLNAWGISPDGQLIYGSGIYGGNIEGFVAEVPLGLVSAIPEPSTDALLGGLAILGIVLRKRRKRVA